MSDVTSNYAATFYDLQRSGSFDAANIILPMVFDLGRPNSLIDFGCGVGTWLAVAKRLVVSAAPDLKGRGSRSSAWKTPRSISSLPISNKMWRLASASIWPCPSKWPST